jgi:AcrR family transcriptional regulator
MLTVRDKLKIERMRCPLTASPIDRRVRRSRRELQRALVELVIEKGYDATTIEDIATRADVARATFYAHYADKHALLISIAADLVDNLEQQLAPRAPVTTATVRGEVVLELFRHAEQNRDTYRALLCGAGDPPAYEILVSSLARATAAVFAARDEALGLTPQMPPDFLARLWVGEHVALLSWWLFDDVPYTAGQMALMRMRYDSLGMAWAHGFAPGQFVFDETHLFGPEDEIPSASTTSVAGTG